MVDPVAEHQPRADAYADAYELAVAAHHAGPDKHKPGPARCPRCSGPAPCIDWIEVDVGISSIRGLEEYACAACRVCFRFSDTDGAVCFDDDPPALPVVASLEVEAPPLVKPGERPPLWEGAIPIAVIGSLTDDERERLAVALDGIGSVMVGRTMPAQLALAYEAGIVEGLTEAFASSPEHRGAVATRYRLRPCHVGPLIGLSVLALYLARASFHWRGADPVAVWELVYTAAGVLRDRPAQQPPPPALPELPAAWLSLGLLGGRSTPHAATVAPDAGPPTVAGE